MGGFVMKYCMWCWWQDLQFIFIWCWWWKYAGFFLVLMIKSARFFIMIIILTGIASNHTKATNMLGNMPKREGQNGSEYNPVSGLGILLYTKHPNIQQNNTSTFISPYFTFILLMMSHFTPLLLHLSCIQTSLRIWASGNLLLFF